MRFTYSGNDACPRVKEYIVARSVEAIGEDRAAVPRPCVQTRSRASHREVAFGVFANRGGLTIDECREPFTRCVGAVKVKARREFRVLNRRQNWHQHGQ